MNEEVSLAELIEFRDFSEIEKREKFVPELDRSQITLVKPIGYYRHLKEAVRCGLKDCHHEHFTGLVVLTSADTEGNIGQDCGVTQFGDVFTKMLNQVDRLERRKSGIERARRLHQEADSIRTQIERLMNTPLGSEWVAASMDSLRAFLPSQVTFELGDRARRRQDEVFELVELSSREKEIRREARGFTMGAVRGNRQDNHKQDPRGRLEGLEIWKTNPHALLNELRAGLNEAISKNLHELRPAQLRDMALWADALDVKLAEAARLIEAGRRFFEPENISRLQFLESLPRDKVLLIRGLEWHYEKAKPGKLRPGR